MFYSDLKNLIGSEVMAIGSCGMKKNQEVIGVLSQDNGQWIVTILDEEGFELPCSVYAQTIKEN